MKKLILPLALLSASPAFAAGGPFFSLHNTNFFVLLAFIVFVGILLKAGAPGKIAGLLDARAVKIKADLDEARALRDEAKEVLAKQANPASQAASIDAAIAQVEAKLH